MKKETTTNATVNATTTMNTAKKEGKTMTKNTTKKNSATKNTTKKTTAKKEDKNMTKKTSAPATVTETPAPVVSAPKPLTKKAQSLIADIQAITPAYGDRLQTLSTPDLTALRRMLKDRARLLEKTRKAEEAAEAKRNAEPKQTVAQKLAVDAEQLVGYYTMTTNAKGHTYIKDTETGKTLAKVLGTRKGVMLAPKADVVNTLPDKGWEYHPGWASKFTLPLADMAAVRAVLDEYWTAKEAEVEEQ